VGKVKIGRWSLIGVLIILLACGCGNNSGKKTNSEYLNNSIDIFLSDNKIMANGEVISDDSTNAVYKANDIVYYEAGKDFTYGEGSESDEHTKEEADSHTVVHITQPGTYVLSGSLSNGQIAIDLGEDAEQNPDAVVTLLLNNVDVKCSVAPAVIFYNVYECGSTDGEVTKDVDTSKAGANVVILDGTTNNIEGSYVARIYKSYELNEDGTEVIDSKKLHKYDAAFYSKMTMNIDGANKNDGVLNIKAENEGLDSELHLTINGGNINIVSGNDGINTNEDGISVTTINGGTLKILVDGSTGEGDGIDSNGWLVINGGTVIAEACSFSADAGIDSDMGIHINGGTVIATGNMLDRISESNQNFAVFNMNTKGNDSATYSLKNSKNKVVMEYEPQNDFSTLILSSKDLTEGSYTLWKDDKQLSGASGGGMMMGGPGINGGGMKERPDGMEIPPEMPERMENPNGRKEMGKIGVPPEMPDGVEMPEKMAKPDSTDMTKEFGKIERGGRNQGFNNFELSTDFEIVNGGNYFSNVSMIK